MQKCLFKIRRLKIRMSNHSRLAKGGKPLAMSGSYRIRRTILCKKGPQVANSNWLTAFLQIAATLQKTN